MQRLPIDDVKPGMILAKPIFYKQGNLMLNAGVKLDYKFITKLKSFGFDSLIIYDQDTEDIIINDYISEKAMQKITLNVRQIYEGIKTEIANNLISKVISAESDTELRHTLESKAIKSAVSRLDLQTRFLEYVEELIDSITSETDLSMCVGTLRTLDNYFFTHSVEVAIHSAIIAKKCNFTRDEIKQIVIGSLIHDIGYQFIPENILFKTNHDKREKRILQMHTVYGYHLTKEWPMVGLLPAHMAYQHHERLDKSGFPRGIGGTDEISKMNHELTIHRFAKVIAVPNFYDGHVSKAPFRKKSDRQKVVSAIRKLRGVAFCSKIVDIFLSYLPVFPAGTVVLVSSGKYEGYKAVVVDTNKDDFDRPKIRITRDKDGKRLSKKIEIELAKTDIQIKALV